MILVTGATGNAGGAVVRALMNSGERVRAVVRDPDRVSLPAGVEVTAGDLNEPGTLMPHFEGATAAFLLSGYEGLEDTLANNPAMAAAAAAGRRDPRPLRRRPGRDHRP